MDDVTIIQPVAAKAPISEREMARRRKLVRKADANNRLEGICRGPETNEIFDAYIRGDIDVTDIGSRHQAQRGPRQRVPN